MPADTVRPSEVRNPVLGWVRRIFVFVFAAALAWWAEPSPLEWGIGLGLAAIGEWIRVWSAGYLVKSKQLITGGPYQRVRNPLYLGRFFILSGVCVGSVLPGHANLIVLAVALAVFFGYYIPRKERVEPERLERLHGDAYARYKAAVPCLVPRLTAYGNPYGAWRWANFVENEEFAMVIGLTFFFGVLAVGTGIF